MVYPERDLTIDTKGSRQLSTVSYWTASSTRIDIIQAASYGCDFQVIIDDVFGVSKALASQTFNQVRKGEIKVNAQVN